MKEICEVIVECGTTYQPLTLGLDLLSRRYTIHKAHIITTHTACASVRQLLDELFPDLSYIVYGEFVDGAGSPSDQYEYSHAIRSAIAMTRYTVVGLVASGTNWMTWHFALQMSAYQTYIVQTLKEFQDQCFLPHHMMFGVDDKGGLLSNKDGSVSTLLALESPTQTMKMVIKDKKILFLGHEVVLSLQEAAMFDYFLACKGVIDCSDPCHDEAFNTFCERETRYDNNRVFVENFESRFRQNVSKINAKLESSHPLVNRHLHIHKISKSLYKMASPEVLGLFF